MLILSRKLNESIVIDGRITVKIMRVDGEVVKLGIAAPTDVPVHRQEVYDEICKSNREALTQRTSPVPRLSKNGATHAARSPAKRWQDDQHKSDMDCHSPKLNQNQA